MNLQVGQQLFFRPMSTWNLNALVVLTVAKVGKKYFYLKGGLKMSLATGEQISKGLHRWKAYLSLDDIMTDKKRTEEELEAQKLRAQFPKFFSVEMCEKKLSLGQLKSVAEIVGVA